MTMLTYVDSQDRGSYTSLTLVIPREGSAVNEGRLFAWDRAKRYHRLI
jgi:hypothetical protein